MCSQTFKPLSITFMGTPEFAVPSLAALHEAGHKIVAVYTQPPRPAGRGQKETPSPVQEYAMAHNLPVQPLDKQLMMFLQSKTNLLASLLMQRLPFLELLLQTKQCKDATALHLQLRLPF